MIRKFKCNRCANEYTRESKYKEDTPEYIRLAKQTYKKIKYKEFYKQKIITNYYSLCESCLEEFEQWINPTKN